MNTEKLSNEAQTPALNKGAVSSRYRVNVLHGGKERWKYCRTIKRAKHLQESAKAGGLCSIIYQKTTEGYVVCGL